MAQTSNVRYMLVWKDEEGLLPRYFGPFVDMTAAERFRDELPRPKQGGCSDVKPIETGDQHYLPSIKETILRARKRRAYEHAHP